ncbi:MULTISPECIES: PadR family transcriptional regulator [unclassified Tolypothrix]|uniref:PadR family transcriptional regulator n=1 Tax=unclassified Tolypothrix TaxID=2649714 RepID=UPI0005EAB454|nr:MULTISPECIES: PadR family transcriptional regulator [unclassified Tolypothrix]BAY96057.1 transcriptional regulator, PadR family protein [Microchaete diplosiphon NIES-3275]EKE98234.1 putative PadR family transcriptional regulator [Tolypothrix sp. PCC 7601]MBE9085519.1 PadR family transcriptional regulator [Tolypothrix sp. LEGE 11397]UYD31117.1 PadR family transcriptional regulator [Tolypothrix sp. PCC 7712]UYD38921.1 PadR family transcriptional regulator [Tolypothrix sp. PCC 7601]
MSEKKHETDGVKLSALEEDILTLLRGLEMYGLEILDGLNDGRPIPIGFGSLYPTLNRLEKKGLVSWKWGDEQDETGGARRKYYKVTGLGANVLREVQEYREKLANRGAAQGQPGLQGT